MSFKKDKINIKMEEIRKILDDMPVTDAERVGLLEAIKFDILTDMREE